MPPIRNVGPRVPPAAGHVDAPELPKPAAASATTPRDASARSTFERRPEVVNLTRHDGSANTTWSQRTQSLGKALDAKTYFPSGLSNRIWDHFFSGKDASGGNKYTVSGIAPESTYTAPLMRKLDAEVVRGLAGSDEKREKFAKAFEDKIAEGLPHGLGVLWDRINGNDGDEVKQYGKLVDTAFAHAREVAGI